MMWPSQYHTEKSVPTKVEVTEPKVVLKEICAVIVTLDSSAMAVVVQ